MPKDRDKQLRTPFMRALQALAQAAQVQVELFEDGACVGEALVQRFDDAWKKLKALGYSRLSARQRGKVRSLSAYLRKLSDQHDLVFWQELDALYEDERWQEIRVLAQAVLLAFDWKNERPPRFHPDSE
jgi:ribonuclease HI